MNIERTSTFPLCEKVSSKNFVKNLFHIIFFFLLLSLPVYRILSHQNHDTFWHLALLCELWFAFYWVLIISIKWNPVHYKTYPERLLKWRGELPSVDMFVTTADAVLEPAILTINTVLSLLAVDYPTHKLACYVSDDGCSPIILYSLMEASKFAKLWVPFCKKYNIQVRAPFRYFYNSDASSFDHHSNKYSKDFQQEWINMKDEYEQLSCKIEAAVEKSVPDDLIVDFENFLNTQRNNHPTIIKVIWENKQVTTDELPHLVYISREKRPKHPHHYKAGAMNVLTRISGMMTNAPFMLNVDCDMFVNDPNVVLSAMCLLSGPKPRNDIAFVQFPQVFYDRLKDDPFGNQMIVMFEYMAKGITGLQGPCYGGTGCFHRRKIIYGLSPDDTEHIDAEQDEGLLIKRFGNSKEFARAATNALKGNYIVASEIRLQTSVETAYQVASCSYEKDTSWGTKIGWTYGSTTEDINTGLSIHKKGWRSALCVPDPPAFLGCAPTNGPSSMIQQKRWATGLLEVLLSKNCPIFVSLFGKLQLRQGLAYLWILLWGLCSIPELCYSLVLAYSIIANSQLYPKTQEPAFIIPIAIFGLYNLYTILEYFVTGQSIRAWWNNQRMIRIISMGPWILGVIGVVLKLLGISDTVFEVTKKDQSTSGGTSTTDHNDVNANVGTFTFDESLVFVPVTALLLVQLIALAMAFLRLQPPVRSGGPGSGVLEVFCSLWLVLCLWTILKGLFGKGKYGIPFSTIFKSIALALLFVAFCKIGQKY
ncbi:cellulose synthase-like protein H1 [Humulus lupulus]|uniref:cellulose synthase-like protein H1 n=1 Tax=Humulus lupulus TaxID=3486 RepID=UPI002B409984|nr:cellulose synthase-like protein H1 [Humulus lupulus]